MIPTTRRISESLLRRCSVLCSTFQERIGVYSAQPLRGKKDDANSITSLFKPVPIKSNLDDINVGAELTGTLDKTTLLQVLNKFYQKEEIKALAVENGLDHEDKYNKSKTMEIGPAVPEFGDGCGEDLSLFSVLKAIDLYDKRRSAIAFAGINLQKTHYVCQKHFKPNQIIDNVTIRDISGKVLLQHQAFISFRRYCLETEALPVDLHVVISDILQGAGHIDDIFPYFIRHAKQTFPHIECLEDLRKISDLRTPANWYPLARAKTRKIIFHAGPTNSGKTHHALERFMTAKSGVYCGPLKLLATEVFHKSNSRGTACDLITGEERRLAQGDGNPSSHISCTIEMANISNPYEVAVIDEVQLIKDSGRGWAWTRALLGLPADEIHLCGEAATIDLVRSICTTTGEDVEVRRYKRLTPLEIEETALGSLDNVVAGDCIVCFSKSDIYSVSRAIEARGMEVAVIYGSLPPGTKLAQAAKFNDVASPCKVLIATDAIGMGLNLSIRRIIFYSLMRPTINEKGEKEIDVISVSSALQIAGRAGRYGTQWDKGFVTAFKQADLRKLSNLLSQEPEVITQAGLYPTADQIELYTYYLPNSTLSNLMDIFVSLSIVDDSLYFMCNIEDFKFLADMIQHVPLPLRARYTFCCAPVNKKLPFVCTMFLKFARQYSKNETLTFDWLCQNIGWPVAAPKTLIDLVHLEAVFDVLDLYLWFSYRFMDLLPDATVVRDTQKELDAVIQNGIIQLTRLLKNSETDSESVSSQVIGKGKLTERLLAQGLLTPNMLQELHKEWHKKNNHEDGSESPKTSRRKRKTK